MSASLKLSSELPLETRSVEAATRLNLFFDHRADSPRPLTSNTCFLLKFLHRKVFSQRHTPGRLGPRTRPPPTAHLVPSHPPRSCAEAARLSGLGVKTDLIFCSDARACVAAASQNHSDLLLRLSPGFNVSLIKSIMQNALGDPPAIFTAGGHGGLGRKTHQPTHLQHPRRLF